MSTTDYSFTGRGPLSSLAKAGLAIGESLAAQHDS